MLLLDGRALAARRLPALRARADAVRAVRSRAPRLGILAFGDAAGIAPHVAGKQRAGAAAGVEVALEVVPAAASLDEALARCASLAADARLDGLFVQFPYPDASWAAFIEQAIPEHLDVDVMSPARVLRFSTDAAMLPPVTVSAALALVDAFGVTVRGLEGVVVAEPSDFSEMFRVAFMRRGALIPPVLSPADAATDPRLARASLVIVATGRPGFVRALQLAPDAVAIDVGYFNAGGRGDIDVGEGVSHLGALAPVPGGIGPMTISCLIERTISFAEGNR